MSFAFKRGEHVTKHFCAFCGRLVAHRRSEKGPVPVRHSTRGFAKCPGYVDRMPRPDRAPADPERR